MSLSPGEILCNRYRVDKLLAQGGFGAVYAVWDQNLERQRALKENLDISPATLRQFKREAQMLSDLTHPNLPKVIDQFVIPHQGQYLVMEYVEGQDLRQIIQQRQAPLSENQAIIWAAQICEALEYLHAQQPPVIHRDVKPANIKITPKDKAMLVDFGIAKFFNPDQSTTAGAHAVSSGFSPIEQYGSGSRTDVRSDIYSLGATLYYLLTAQTPTDALERNLGEKLPAPQALNPEISSQAAAVILEAMALFPEHRYSNISAFKNALLGIAQPAARLTPVLREASEKSAIRPLHDTRALLQIIPAPDSIPFVPATRPLSRARRKWLWIGVGLLLVIVVIAALWWLI